MIDITEWTDNASRKFHDILKSVSTSLRVIFTDHETKSKAIRPPQPRFNYSSFLSILELLSPEYQAAHPTLSAPFGGPQPTRHMWMVSL